MDLKLRIKILENKSNIVEWYITVMEQGHVPRDIMERYLNEKKAFEEKEQVWRKQIKEYKQEIKKLEQIRKVALEKLTKQ